MTILMKTYLVYLSCALVYSGSRGSVLELADSLVLLYHCCAHRTLVRAGLAKEATKKIILRIANIRADINRMQKQQVS